MNLLPSDRDVQDLADYCIRHRISPFVLRGLIERKVFILKDALLFW